MAAIGVDGQWSMVNAVDAGARPHLADRPAWPVVNGGDHVLHWRAI